MLIGGLGNDILTGAGGADILRGGAGEDVLGVSGTTFADINGGNGFDILRLDGAGDTFDFSTMPTNRIKSVEAFDLTGTGNNGLLLGMVALSLKSTPGKSSARA